MTCKVDGCDTPHRSRGWCTRHYQRWYLTGTTDLVDTDLHYRAPGVDEDTLDLFQLIAGNGDLDARCRRILSACRQHWWGEP